MSIYLNGSIQSLLGVGGCDPMRSQSVLEVRKQGWVERQIYLKTHGPHCFLHASRAGGRQGVAWSKPQGQMHLWALWIVCVPCPLVSLTPAFPHTDALFPKQQMPSSSRSPRQIWGWEAVCPHPNSKVLDRTRGCPPVLTVITPVQAFHDLFQMPVPTVVFEWQLSDCIKLVTIAQQDCFLPMKHSSNLKI